MHLALDSQKKDIQTRSRSFICSSYVIPNLRAIVPAPPPPRGNIGDARSSSSSCPKSERAEREAARPTITRIIAESNEGSEGRQPFRPITQYEGHSPFCTIWNLGRRNLPEHSSLSAEAFSSRRSVRCPLGRSFALGAVVGLIKPSFAAAK